MVLPAHFHRRSSRLCLWGWRGVDSVSGFAHSLLGELVGGGCTLNPARCERGRLEGLCSPTENSRSRAGFLGGWTDLYWDTQGYV